MGKNNKEMKENAQDQKNAFDLFIGKKTGE
jgi:hypothetical protein